MTSPIGSVAALSGLIPTGLGADMSVGTTTTSSAATPGAGGSSFANVLASSLDNLQGAQSKADNLAVQAATGDLKDVHDYMIASNEASLATQMTVTLKNKAVDAFNQIMGMPV
jgi:flagellar hook-basal body complex protein FliE